MSLQSRWYERKLSPALWPLFPLHWLFVAVAALRRVMYRLGVLHREQLPVTVIVVGNLTVGGTGKTPLVLWLTAELQRYGWKPGIISRGYGGSGDAPLAVTSESLPTEVGDEPLLLARRSGVPVWVGRDRVGVAKALLAAHPAVDLILSDDGLQHYALARDAEIVVFDGRGAGNGWRLPLGPLREPLSRLANVTAVVCNGASLTLELPPTALRYEMRLRPTSFYRLDRPELTAAADDLRGLSLHAMAGIGDPGRFFRTLEGLGLSFAAHPFADHHAYSAADFNFPADAVLLMTEKDAVKCAGITHHTIWVLPVNAELPQALVETLLEKFHGR